MSSEDTTHTKRDNIEVVINDKTDEVIQKLFESLFSRYQVGLEAPIKGRYFIFDYIDSLHYKCHELNLKSWGSHIDSLDLIKNKTATMNPINKYDGNCFQYPQNAFVKT